MTGSHTKALKAHRKRLRTRGLQRVEVTVTSQDADLIREMAAALRQENPSAQRVRTLVRRAVRPRKAVTLAEALSSGPDVSGPEFDEVFEEIERFRHDPVMMKVRDVDL